jgi:drug/metabolite transporter (DMT)-like permease
LSIISAIGFATTFKLSQMAALLTGELQATLMARVVATVLLGLIILRHKEHLNIVKTAFVPLIIMGILDGIALVAVISAAAKDSPQLAAVAASLFGLFTILLAWMFLKERMTYLQWFGCLLTFLAIGYLSI